MTRVKTAPGGALADEVPGSPNYEDMPVEDVDDDHDEPEEQLECTNCGEDIAELDSDGDPYCGDYCVSCCTCGGCDCTTCPSCDEKISAACDNCEQCDGCCSCSWCDSGQHHVDSLDFCHDCEHCYDECQCDDEGDSNEEHSYGQCTKPPWEARGITITRNEIQALRDEIIPITEGYRGVIVGSNERGLGDTDFWRAFWTVENNTIDPTQSMAVFYLLDGIAGYVWNGFNGLRNEPAAQVLAQEAQDAQDDLVRALDPSFRDYADMAIGGELRYHGAVGGSNKPLQGERTVAWTHWKIIRDKVGPDALVDAATLFREISSGGVGGEKWAVATDVLHARVVDKIDPRTFVDRVFTLQHNGGAFINKIRWANRNEPGWGIEAMHSYIGPAHSAPEPVMPILLAAASTTVRGMFYTWWRAANRLRRLHGLPVTIAPTLNHGLDEENSFRDGTRRLRRAWRITYGTGEHDWHVAEAAIDYSILDGDLTASFPAAWTDLQLCCSFLLAYVGHQYYPGDQAYTNAKTTLQGLSFGVPREDGTIGPFGSGAYRAHATAWRDWMANIPVEQWLPRLQGDNLDQACWLLRGRIGSMMRYVVNAGATRWEKIGVAPVVNPAAWKQEMKEQLTSAYYLNEPVISKDANGTIAFTLTNSNTDAWYSEPIAQAPTIKKPTIKEVTA